MNANDAYQAAQQGALNRVLSKVNSDIAFGKTRSIVTFPPSSNTSTLKADLEERGFIVEYQDYTSEEIKLDDRRKVFIIDSPEPNI